MALDHHLRVAEEHYQYTAEREFDDAAAVVPAVGARTGRAVAARRTAMEGATRFAKFRSYGENGKIECGQH